MTCPCTGPATLGAHVPGPGPPPPITEGRCLCELIAQPLAARVVRLALPEGSQLRIARGVALLKTAVRA